MIRLLHVAQPTVGGVASCVAELAGAAVEAGMDVTVACPPSGELARRCAEVGARHVAVAIERSPGPGDLATLGRLRHLVGSADVVHLHSSKAGVLGRLGAVMTRPRPATVFSPHGWSWLVGGRFAPVYRGLERRLAAQADTVVAVSHGEAAEGRRVLGNRARLRVIENGVDTGRFTPEGPVADRDKAPLLVCVGRLCEQKGQDVAIAALAHLRDLGARLRLVGDGPAREDLVRLACLLGVARFVEMVGETPDVAPHLRAADVVVFASRWEGLSLAMLEAMACAAPIVTTSVAGSEVVHGVGETVPVDAPDALASAVRTLLGDTERRRALGRAARQRAVDRFDSRRTLQAHVALWQDLASRRGGVSR